MKKMIIGLLLVAVSILSACGGSTTSAAAAAPAAGTNTAGGQGFQQVTSAYLKRDYDGALSVTMQAALGTMKLEGTNNAVTADQAAKLLPLWQATESDAIQNPTEINAVYKQIESTMTPAQMQAIAAMKLTRTELQSWAQSQGIQMPTFGQGQGGQQGLSADAIATRRAGFANQDPSAQATRRAQFAAQGGQGRRGGQNMMKFLTDPLLKLLTTRVAK
ncbi:MAG: hypothetical protein NT075_12805 [Chloroflexi bacterium]|nr:hypothetical protein [Chloroflexota bacterium]